LLVLDGDVTSHDQVRECARCGAVADWLVVLPYDAGTAPGRTLVYCEACRKDGGGNVATTLPLRLVDADPNRTLTLLYEVGVTRSDPTGLAKMLRLPEESRWVDRAKRLTAED
jgi:hypothetical protein